MVQMSAHEPRISAGAARLTYCFRSLSGGVPASFTIGTPLSDSTGAGYFAPARSFDADAHSVITVK